MDDIKYKKQLKFRVDQLIRWLGSDDISDKKVKFTIDEQILYIESSLNRGDRISVAFLLFFPTLPYFVPDGYDNLYLILVAFFLVSVLEFLGNNFIL